MSIARLTLVGFVLTTGACTSVLWTLHARAAEGSLFQTHFASVAGGQPCYARNYPQEHLSSHPEQRVTDIEVDMAKLNPDGKPITEDNIELGFGLKVKGKSEWYTNVAICKSAGAQMECYLEGDGGRFTLDASGASLKLSTGSYGIAIEGSNDFVELSGENGDDRVFILPIADQKVCAVVTEDGEQN